MGLVFNSCAESEADLLVQQRCGWTSAKGRLRREDCKFVKHDKFFSKWKILLGPSDSADQINSAGMQDKACHVHNLPATETFGPGVYELGVTAPSWSKAPKNTRALKREDVIPVYIGQAANIRQRLQKFGQAGAHFFEQAGSRSPKLLQGKNGSVGSRSPRMAQSGLAAKYSGNGSRLLSEVFALGSSIAFRWAHTDSKAVAEQVESELLAVFDYAWNKSTTGTRRSRDILAKLFMAWPTKHTTRYSRLRNFIFSGRKPPRWLFSCGRRTSSVGIKVALRKPKTSPTSSTLMSSLCFHMIVQPQRSIMACNAPPRKLIMKLQAESTARRECVFPTKEVEEKTQVAIRRHNSLSFNTWVKGESDQRVHDSSKMSDSASFQKLSERRRVQHLGSKYASVCNCDSMRR